jgi:hypothetical protein
MVSIADSNTTKPLVNEPMWKTKEGVVLPVSAMSDSHLTNAITYIKRRASESYSNTLVTAKAMIQSNKYSKILILQAMKEDLFENITKAERKLKVLIVEAEKRKLDIR